MTKVVPVVEKILGANESLAEKNRARLDEHKVFGINLMASPGAGKTSLIEQTLPKLAERYRIAVIDGDIATSIDADRAPRQAQMSPCKSTRAAVAISTPSCCKEVLTKLTLLYKPLPMVVVSIKVLPYELKNQTFWQEA